MRYAICRNNNSIRILFDNAFRRNTSFLRKHQPGLIDPSHARCDVTRRNRFRPAEDVAWRDRRLRQRQFNRVNAPVLELYSHSSSILEKIKVAYPEFWHSSTGDCRKSNVRSRSWGARLWIRSPISFFSHQGCSTKSPLRYDKRPHISYQGTCTGLRKRKRFIWNVFFTPVAGRKRDNSDKGCKFEPRLC